VTKWMRTTSPPMCSAALSRTFCGRRRYSVNARRRQDVRGGCPCGRARRPVASRPRRIAMARTLGALLFHDFEVLDLFGPLEMFGNMPGKIDVVTVAEQAGPVRSARGPRVRADPGLPHCPPADLPPS